MDFILQPWPWYISGPLIALTMFCMFYFGKRLGISSNLENMCSMLGAGKLTSFFSFDWRTQKWNLSFIVGLVIGGFIAFQYLTPNKTVKINPKTEYTLNELGFKNIGDTYLPSELFNFEEGFSIKNISILLIAGILVGFGARYAGGCTSGHAIVGLSSLQMPSLKAVIGFFAGGLVMIWIIYPLIFSK